MKKFVSIVLLVSFVMLSSFGAVSVSPVRYPELMTVKAEENGDYGYIDYSFADAEGNEIELFGGQSYEPQNPQVSLFSFFSSLSSPSLPLTYDSREENCITSVKQQGLSGNCWAFSTMSMLESDAVLKGIDELESADYSEAHFSWFTSRSLTDNTDDSAYGDGRDDDDPFMTGGNWIIAAGSLARWMGAAEETDYPFAPRDLSAMGNYDESCRYDTGSGVIIDSAEELLNMNDAKEWIMTHGSATLAFYFDTAYYNSETAAYFYNGTNTLNHEITVVGWDDNFSADNFNSAYQPSGNGAWLCKNSWGTSWGDGGYFWISYYDTSIEQFAGISARSADDFYRNYTYNGAGWESYIGHTGNAKISNVFKAKGPELLSSVSTYTMNPEQEINVKIYKNLPDAYTNPESGELAAEYSTVLERSGYHTIDLETKVELEEETIFSVVIEYITSGTIYIPVEANGQGMNAYSCNACESYVCLPAYNQGWYDVMIYGFENVFVQAFTECNHQLIRDCVEATCTESGYEISTCSVCGKIASEKILAASGHDFSEWSGYTHDFETGKEVSVRTCLKCGISEKNTIVYSKNTVRIDDFMSAVFERIIEFLRQMFIS